MACSEDNLKSNTDNRLDTVSDACDSDIGMSFEVQYLTLVTVLFICLLNFNTFPEFF